VNVKKLDELLQTYLFEQPEKEDKPETEVEKDKDKETKDIEDVEKQDLDEPEEEEPEEEEIAVSIKYNDNDKRGGQIKLINYKRLSSLNSIESLLGLFDIDPENVAPDFQDKIQITINSPLSDFKEEEYIINLMDKSGEISIYRPDFKTTIEKQSKGNLEQVVQQGTAEPGTEAAKPKKEIDLGYLPELNVVFRRTVKNEFFDRILDKG
jgi:hypothetical protein